MRVMARRQFLVVLFLGAVTSSRTFAQEDSERPPAQRNPLEGAGQLALVAEGYETLEGPQWIPAAGVLLFVDFYLDAIYRLTPPSSIDVLRTPANRPHALALDEQGRLLVAETGQVTRGLGNGRTETVIDRAKLGWPISPNDLVVRSGGTIYFTSLRGQPDNAVFRVAPDGSFSTIWEEDPASELKGPNGIALSPDETILYVTYIREGVVRAFDLREDGSAVDERVLARTGRSPDGMAVDQEGNLFVASSGGGVDVFAPDGTRWGNIPIPPQPPQSPGVPSWNSVTNVAFGGPDARTLYITARASVYRIDLPIPGIY